MNNTNKQTKKRHLFMSVVDSAGMLLWTDDWWPTVQLNMTAPILSYGDYSGSKY